MDGTTVSIEERTFSVSVSIAFFLSHLSPPKCPLLPIGRSMSITQHADSRWQRNWCSSKRSFGTFFPQETFERRTQVSPESASWSARHQLLKVKLMYSRWRSDETRGSRRMVQPRQPSRRIWHGLILSFPRMRKEAASPRKRSHFLSTVKLIGDQLALVSVARVDRWARSILADLAR
jgi:hypothetical protein